jgi:energy-coupling factor transport system permease protein
MIHPLSKIILIACISFLSVILDNTLALALLLLFCVLLHMIKPGFGSGRSFSPRSLLKLIPIIVSVFLIQLLFNRSGNKVFGLSCFSVTDKGLITALQVAMRLMILLSSGAWLWGMPSREVLRAFRSLGVPETFSILLLMTLSFLPELSRQVKNKLILIRLRGLAAGRFALVKRMRLYLQILLPILGWTLKDLHMKAAALDLKGFRNGCRHTRFRQGRLGIADYLIIVLVIVLTAALPLLLQS